MNDSDSPESLEIIDFFKPFHSSKTLYITNISPECDDNELHEVLYKKFSEFGLLHDVIVKEVLPFPGLTTYGTNCKAPVGLTTTGTDSKLGGQAEVSDKAFYAFVIFYSETAATLAKHGLTGRLVLKGQLARIRNSLPKKRYDSKPYLYVSKCYELANYYLGYSSWTTDILSLAEVKDVDEDPSYTVCYRCVARVTLPDHALHAEGIGIAHQNWTNSDPVSRGVACGRASKQAYRQAIEDAFSKILLVLLPDGKVYPEVNTTVEELHYYDEDLQTEVLLQVNELDKSPSNDSDEEASEESQEQNEITEEMLLELAAQSSN